MTSRRDAAVLRAAVAACDLFVARGSTRMTVAEIAAAIGISERSFYRYFATKEESIMPVFVRATDAFGSGIEARPGSLREAVIGAFSALFEDDASARVAKVFPLVVAEAELWSVFLRVTHRAEVVLAPLFARRLGLPDESIESRATAAAVVSASRLAFERMAQHGADPRAVFAEVIDVYTRGGLDRPALS